MGFSQMDLNVKLSFRGQYPVESENVGCEGDLHLPRFHQMPVIN